LRTGQDIKPSFWRLWIPRRAGEPMPGKIIVKCTTARCDGYLTVGGTSLPGHTGFKDLNQKTSRSTLPCPAESNLILAWVGLRLWRAVLYQKNWFSSVYCCDISIANRHVQPFKALLAVHGIPSRLIPSSQSAAASENPASGLSGWLAFRLLPPHRVWTLFGKRCAIMVTSKDRTFSSKRVTKAAILTVFLNMRLNWSGKSPKFLWRLRLTLL